MTETDVPSTIRRVDTDSAAKLLRLVAAYDDMQTALWCCERLVPLVGEGGGGAADISVEAMWTLALLCYARCFTGDDAPLSGDDHADSETEGEPQRSHQLLMHLRDRHADPTVNPREVFTAGVAQDESGEVNAVAVTSVRDPALDEAAVLRLGALAYPLCAVMDERIAQTQKTILDETRAISKDELNAMELIEVAATG